MFTGPCALIDHGALRANLALARQHAPSSRIWAVVKADAYGHGLLEVAESLAGADGLAVARVDEGVRLREAGIGLPILVLEGAIFSDEVEAAARHRLELALHQEEQLALLEQARAHLPLRVWIKVDTGMHRLGVQPEAVPDLMERLARSLRVADPPGLMTHLANADRPDDGLTLRQCTRLRALAPPGALLSIGNSAGILAFAAARTDWVRPGIMLYGSSPFAERSAAGLGLRPVMTLQTRLIAIKHLRQGDALGYGGTWVCPEDMAVGVAGIGYGDGYPRHAPSGTPVLIAGRRAPLVGRVSMDLISIDLRGLPEVKLGDPVTLWGEGLPVDEIAARAGTISYELLCRVTPRVPRQHLVACS
jgi:alanine racemase